MMRLVALAGVITAACYAPVPPSGSPCTDDASCPSPLICAATMTCERMDRMLEPDAAPPPNPDASCSAELCGDGIDQDCNGSDVACVGNDAPAGALDITAGGTFTGDALLARDDVQANGCGGMGGRDVFYRVELTAPQVYYFDTFGSSFDTVLRVYAKPCADVGAGVDASGCADNSCGGAQSQLAVALPAGESCIVIDQSSATELTGDVKLEVIRGGRDGKPLAGGATTTTGDTCSSTNITDPSDQNCDGPGANGKDHAFFFTTCPGQTLVLDADICPAPAWDPVLYVKRINGTQLGCNDDSCGFGPELDNVAVSNSLLTFLYVDGFDQTHCGPYSLDTNLRP